MAKKRKRRLGHITKVEKTKAKDAFSDAFAACQKFDGEAYRGCMNGIHTMRMSLKRRGL